MPISDLDCSANQSYAMVWINNSFYGTEFATLQQDFMTEAIPHDHNRTKEACSQSTFGNPSFYVRAYEMNYGIINKTRKIVHFPYSHFLIFFGHICEISFAVVQLLVEKSHRPDLVHWNELAICWGRSSTQLPSGKVQAPTLVWSHRFAASPRLIDIFGSLFKSPSTACSLKNINVRCLQLLTDMPKYFALQNANKKWTPVGAFVLGFIAAIVLLSSRWAKLF